MRGGIDRSQAFELSVREEGAKLPLPMKKLEELTALAFRAAGSEPGGVSLVVSDDDFIAALNEKYLGERGPTDVLSFPLQEGRGEKTSHRPRGGPQSVHLGDIVISVDTAVLQAKEAGKELAEEFLLLYLHGLLHLLGFTHETARDGAVMSEMQRSILSGGETGR
jgi:probable rRNA maturation factor